MLLTELRELNGVDKPELAVEKVLRTLILLGQAEQSNGGYVLSGRATADPSGNLSNLSGLACSGVKW